MKFRNLVGAAIVGGAALFTHAAISPAQAAPCDGPAEVGKLTIMTTWVPVLYDGGPFWVAKLHGYFKEEGLEVEIISPANPADPIKLVARERVNFSLTYVPEVMISRDTGIPVVAVATTLRRLVSGLMSLEETGISSPADFKGKTLGVGPKLDAQAFLQTILENVGLTKKDAKIIDPGFGPIPYVIEKKIHAAHALSNFEVVLGDKILAKSGKPKMRFMKYTDHGVPDFYYQLIVGSETWIKKNPHATCRFLRASIKGLKHFMKDDAKAFDYVVKANNYMTPEEHRLTTDAVKKEFVGPGGEVFTMDLDVWKKAQDWALKYKLITVGANPADYFTNEYTPKM